MVGAKNIKITRMLALIIAIAFNMNRLHNMIQSGRCGLHLFELKKEA